MIAMIAWQSLALLVKASNAMELKYPEVWDVDDQPNITLDFDWIETDPGFGGQPFLTRALGGSVPGPTIKLSPGTILRVNFRNLLKDQPGSYKTTDPGRFNRYGDADLANLHFHGGHVSSVLPADDTTLVVHPGHEYNYTVKFPDDHMPGTHWVHPHHHGSSSIHLVGGAALALIVKDPPGSLPQEVEQADEKVLVFGDWDIRTGSEIARKAGDAAFASSLDMIEGGDDVGQRFVTVNGMYQPTMRVVMGVWTRWRVVYAGWQDLPLNLNMEINEAGCEIQLLAKDGIYIKDYPRTLIGAIPMPPGGRADFMVRCSYAGSTKLRALSRDTLTILSSESKNDTSQEDVSISIEDAPATVLRNGTALTIFGSQLSELTPWQPPSSPDYLDSLMNVRPTDGCSCPFVLKGYDDTSRINGKTYRSGNDFHHTTYLGAVVQRELKGIQEHSYHQHIYPFQLVGGFSESDYFKYGDFHDTLLDVDGKYPTGVTTWQVRYRTTDIAGKMMVHCHNTMHADQGMLAKEYIRDLDSGATCECSIFGPITGPGVIDDINKATIVGGPQEEVKKEVEENGANIRRYCSVVVASCATMIIILLLN